MKRCWLVLAMIVAAAGCSRSPESKGGDVLSNQESPVVYATTECTVKNPNGTEGTDYCNVKTCKKDAESDCTDFAAACLDTGNHYGGTSDAGTCTRVL
jgi:hypothetical protein